MIRGNVPGIIVDVDQEIKGKMLEFDTTGWHEYRNWGKNDHHSFFSDCVQSEATDIAEIFLEKRWSIIVSQDPSFITSDKPLAKENLEKKLFGFGSKGTMVTFPLSPIRLLVMDDRYDQPAGQYYALHSDGPGPFNLGIWRNGCRFMISPRNTDEVISEMLEWAEKLP
jgi:hypothetical protein